MQPSFRSDEFEGVFEPTASRPVMSKPPRTEASKKFIQQVKEGCDLWGFSDFEVQDAADWVADKMERFGARTARPVFDMHGRGPVCSWCDTIWPMCGCHHLSEVDFDDEQDQAPNLENKESVMSTTNPRECCWACEAEPDHCRDVHCACHDFIAVTDHPNRTHEGEER